MLEGISLVIIYSRAHAHTPQSQPQIPDNSFSLATLNKWPSLAGHSTKIDLIREPSADRQIQCMSACAFSGGSRAASHHPQIGISWTSTIALHYPAGTGLYQHSLKYVQYFHNDNANVIAISAENCIHKLFNQKLDSLGADAHLFQRRSNNTSSFISVIQPGARDSPQGVHTHTQTHTAFQNKPAEHTHTPAWPLKHPAPSLKTLIRAPGPSRLPPTRLRGPRQLHPSLVLT